MKLKKVGAVLATVAAITVFAATPAHAAFDETNCHVQPNDPCRTYWLVPAHSTGHWIRVMGQNSGVYLYVYDAVSGKLIWQGLGTGKWVTLNNVYSKYYVWGYSFNLGEGNAYIDNCTSGCHQH